MTIKQHGGVFGRNPTFNDVTVEGTLDPGTLSGYAIGTDVQAYDAGLASIAGLTTASDKMIYTTAADTYAATDLTAAGRAILDDADAAAQRTTLGLGSMATQADNNVDINGGAIDGTAIGANSETTGKFTFANVTGLFGPNTVHGTIANGVTITVKAWPDAGQTMYLFIIGCNNNATSYGMALGHRLEASGAISLTSIVAVGGSWSVSGTNIRWTQSSGSSVYMQSKLIRVY